MISSVVTKDSYSSPHEAEYKATRKVGIIGLGDMGRFYAQTLSTNGWAVVVCDLEERFPALVEEFKDSSIEVVRNGFYVARQADYLMYCVETENIDRIVSLYGASTKVGAVVGGQTSTKAPEIAALEKYIPQDVSIVSCHSMHGPKVDPRGQPLVIIRHRCPSDEQFDFVQSLLSSFKSKFVYLTAEEHDRITADTQAATHAAFLSMGSAWMLNNQYPWKIPKWTGGLENAKINIALRIYNNKWHVYAGLAMANPAAKRQILQYATSVTEIFKLVLEQRQSELTERLQKAKAFVFGSIQSDPNRSLLLTEETLGEFSLHREPPGGRLPNSHLSILGIVDSWYKLGIVPYDHMICSTPLFRIWLGVTEYVFCTPGILEESIEHACQNNAFRADDMEFVFSARLWSDIVAHRNLEEYKEQFEIVQKHFSSMFAESTKTGNEMIRHILQSDS